VVLGLTEAFFIANAVILALTVAIVGVSAAVAFRGGRGNLLSNSLFWVYMLYICCCIASLARLPVLHKCLVDAVFFPILYNITGALIVWISCVPPLRLLQQCAGTGSKKVVLPSINSERTSLVWNVSLFSAALVLGLVTLGVGLSVPGAGETLLLVWRVVFCVSAVGEIALLVACLAVFRETRMYASYQWYCMAALWMRGGIVLAVVLRYTSVLNPIEVSFMVMSFVITGLVFFNYKLLRSAAGFKVQNQRQRKGRHHKAGDSMDGAGLNNQHSMRSLSSNSTGTAANSNSSHPAESEPEHSSSSQGSFVAAHSLSRAHSLETSEEGQHKSNQSSEEEPASPGLLAIV
jgi:hypothetical protein